MFKERENNSVYYLLALHFNESNINEVVTVLLILIIVNNFPTLQTNNLAFSVVFS